MRMLIAFTWVNHSSSTDDEQSEEAELERSRGSRIRRRA